MGALEGNELAQEVELLAGELPALGLRSLRSHLQKSQMTVHKEAVYEEAVYKSPARERTVCESPAYNPSPEKVAEESAEKKATGASGLNRSNCSNYPKR